MNKLNPLLFSSFAFLMLFLTSHFYKWFYFFNTFKFAIFISWAVHHLSLLIFHNPQLQQVTQKKIIYKCFSSHFVFRLIRNPHSELTTNTLPTLYKQTNKQNPFFSKSARINKKGTLKITFIRNCHAARATTESSQECNAKLCFWSLCSIIKHKVLETVRALLMLMWISDKNWVGCWVWITKNL